MRKILTAALILIAICVQAQQPENILDRITKATSGYFNAFPLEKVYIQTDKEVYAPNETIWFNALISNRTSLNLENLSPEIIVNLYNASGQFIMGDKFKISGPKLSADVRVLDALPLGRYYLAVFTPLQLHPEEVYIKPIIVDQPYQQEAKVTLAEPQKVYQPDTDEQINLTVNDISGQPVDRYSFDYAVSQGEKSISSGKLRSTRGTASIALKVPATEENNPLKVTFTHPRNLWTEVYYLSTGTEKLNVKFYPEGGYLVDNVPVKMGFHVTGGESIPVSIEADIVDENGQFLTKATTFTPGFGFLPFKSEPGKTYRMVITGETGKGQIFELPKQNNQKVSLSVVNIDNESINVNLVAPDEAPKKLALAVSERFNIVWAANFDITKSARIRIPINDLGPGINQITVFDSSAEVLASRLIFVPDKEKLQLHTTSEVVGDQVRINVQAQNTEGKPVAANLSVSVADKTKRTMPVDNLLSNFVINSELKNPVVGDQALFNNPTALDYILIANELKAFSWDKVFAFEKDKNNIDFLALKSISGRVINRRGQPVAGALVNVMNSRDMQSQTITADSEGNFIFPVINLVDISQYIISATDERGRATHNVELEPSFSERIGAYINKQDSYLASLWDCKPPLPAYYSTNNSLIVKAPAVIRAVNVNTKKASSDSYKSMLATATSLLDVIKAIRPFSLMSGQIVFQGTQNSLNFQSGALIVIDGQKMGTSADALNMISPYDVESINVSLDPMDIQKYTGFNSVGVIEINTKKGETIEEPKPGQQVEAVQYDGEYRVPRVFLSTHGLRYESGKDLRTTLLWNPELELGNNGSSTFSIPLSEVRSDFLIFIEGMDFDNAVGVTSAEFSVK